MHTFTRTRRLTDRASTATTKPAATARLRGWTTGLAAGILAFLAGAPAALAATVPPPGGDSGSQTFVHPVLASGTPGWQIALIAVGSALLACALTLLAVRATRHAPPQATPIT